MQPEPRPEKRRRLDAWDASSVEWTPSLSRTAGLETIADPHWRPVQTQHSSLLSISSLLCQNHDNPTYRLPTYPAANALQPVDPSTQLWHTNNVITLQKHHDRADIAVSQTFGQYEHTSSNYLATSTFGSQSERQDLAHYSDGLSRPLFSYSEGHPQQEYDRHVNQMNAYYQQASVSCKAEEPVCFGTITTLTACSTGKAPLPYPRAVLSPLQFQSDQGQLFTQSGSLCGEIDTRDGQLLELFANEDIEFDLQCVPPDEIVTASSTEGIQIWATIYGDLRKAETLGEALQELGYYLQDPKYSLRDTEYFNPQRFSNPPGVRTTDFITAHSSADQVTIVQDEPFVPVEILETLALQSLPLSETEGSPYLLTQLKSHQKQALTFMLRREAGWNLSEQGQDVWSRRYDAFGHITYINNVDSSVHHSPPKSFRGGILADTMGLGKTLSMISLIAYDKHMNDDAKGHGNQTNASASASGTLLVLPSSLLHNWEQELRTHLCGRSFQWRRHHGQSRVKDFTEVNAHDIILTTYTTLAKEWQSPDRNSPIFSHNWHRVVLDEAHEIKDAKTAKSQAVCELKASCQWAVSGTPLQNRLSEFLSLFQFLEVFPYDNKQTFTEHIVNPWLRGEDAGPLALKRLLGYIMLRRSKGTIDLPQRHDHRRFLQFSVSEQLAYDLEKAKAIECLDTALASDKPREGYRNALEKVNALRVICELGCYQKNSRPAVAASPDIFRRSGSTAGTPSGSLTPMTPSDDGEDSDVGADGNIGLQLEQFFPSCNEPRKNDYLSPYPGCPQRDPIGTMPEAQWPTKIRALVEDLQGCESGTKSIVFSYRSTILDVASMALEAAGISWAQIDGRTPGLTRPVIKAREPEVDSFSRIRRTYHNIVQQLLAQTSCAGLSQADLISFKQEFGPSAFVCGIQGCERLVVGFASASSLKDHEARHQGKLRCFESDCPYNDVGFSSSKQLQEHKRKRHMSASNPAPIPKRLCYAAEDNLARSQLHAILDDDVANNSRPPRDKSIYGALANSGPPKIGPYAAEDSESGNLPASRVATQDDMDLTRSRVHALLNNDAAGILKPLQNKSVPRAYTNPPSSGDDPFLHVDYATHDFSLFNQPARKSMSSEAKPPLLPAISDLSTVYDARNSKVEQHSTPSADDNSIPTRDPLPSLTAYTPSYESLSNQLPTIRDQLGEISGLNRQPLLEVLRSRNWTEEQREPHREAADHDIDRMRIQALAEDSAPFQWQHAQSTNQTKQGREIDDNYQENSGISKQKPTTPTAYQGMWIAPHEVPQPATLTEEEKEDRKMRGSMYNVSSGGRKTSLSR